MKLFTKELRPIEPYAGCAFLSKSDNYSGDLSATEFPHDFPYQQLGGNVDYVVGDTINDIPSLSLGEMVLLF